MTCAKKVSENLLYDCEDAPKKGIDGGKAVLINMEDIYRSRSEVVGETILDLVLKPGTIGYEVEWYKDLASGNSAFTPSTEDIDGFLHNFLARLSTSSAESAERANELKNGRFVMVYETKYKGIDQEDAFKVAGWESGLLLSEMVTNTAENSGAPLFTLTTEEGDVEKYPYSVFLDTDYATSKTKFEALFDGNAPFYSDLESWHNSINILAFNEQIHGSAYNGLFLPRAASLNGTDDGLDISTPIIQTVATYCMTFKTGPLFEDDNGFLLGNTSASAKYIRFTTEKKIKVATASNSDEFDYDFLINTEYNIIITVTSGFLWSLYVDGVFDSSFTLTQNSMTISKIGTTGSARFFQGNIGSALIYDRVITTQEIKGYNSGSIPNAPEFAVFPKGMGDYEYDVSGNDNYCTWIGTGDRSIYESVGSLYPRNYGYSLWEHSSLEDIQVPLNLSGVALSLTPGVDVPAGYTKTGDVSESTNWNLADAKVRLPEKSPDTWMDNIFKLNITEEPDFDGQWGFDSDIDLVSATQSVKNDLYVALGGSWHLLKEMTFTSTDFSAASPPGLARAVESDDNIGLAWTAQRLTGYLDRISSKELITAYDAVRVKIEAREATELKLSDYATLEAAINALNSAGAGSQLNIDESITMGASDTPAVITVNDIVIYSDNQSVITLGTNNTGSSIFAFTGNDVHIMGVSVDINKDNQSGTFTAIMHTGSDVFSVIGCDCRNGNYHIYSCSASSNGIYGACVGLVSGDDCFTALAASDNIMFEFCIGGCSDNVIGSSSTFEVEDGDSYCTYYKNIGFGQIIAGAFDCHVHPGLPYVTDLLWEECLSLYNTDSYTMNGDNITTGNIRNSLITNCRNIQCFYRLGTFLYTDGLSITDCDFDVDFNSTKSLIYFSDVNVDSVVTGNKAQRVTIAAGTDANVLNNDLTQTVANGLGIFLSGSTGCIVENNVVWNPDNVSAVSFVRCADSDSNVFNNNTIRDAVSIGFEITGTSDLNTGTGNNIVRANTEVADTSSGANTISAPDVDMWNPRDEGLFNRENAKHSAACRAADSYDPEFPNDWLVSELADFTVLSSYFEAAYQDRVFPMIATNDLIEVLNYNTVKAGADLAEVEHYCNLP